MPNKCCVPGCRSNYEKETQYKTIFKFPKAADLRKKWVQKIQRDEWLPSEHSVVCASHFDEKFIVKIDVSTDKLGNIQEFPKNRWTLTSDAVPTIFPNLPKYLSKPTVTVRTNPEARREKHIASVNKKYELWEKSDVINNFEVLVQEFKNKLNNILCKWSYVVEQNVLVLYILKGITAVPQVGASVSINSSMEIKICVNGYIISKDSLKWILPASCKLTRWSQLENILNRYCKLDEENVSAEKIYHQIIKKIKTLFEQLSELIDDNPDTEFQEISQVKFLMQQFLMCFIGAKRYTQLTLYIAFLIYHQSSSCYLAIRSNNILYLPHPRHLNKLAEALNISSNMSNFLKILSNNLTEREKYVVPQLDEIHVNQAYNYKCGSLSGIAENSQQAVAAKTVQAFLISSAFGNFKQVVALKSVLNLTGSELADLTMKAVKLVQDSGFVVISIISDNNRINRNMMSILSGGTLSIKIKNPKYEHLNIYLLFDPVHILKSIRNNWLNQKDGDKTFIYPYFPNQEDSDTSSNKLACFSHLRNLYRNESHLLLKSAHKLNFKSVYPTNLERQKVVLAQNIFDQSTIVALSNSEIVNVNETVSFLHIISKWWTIVNVKSKLKGIFKRENNAKPFTTVDDD